jgi:hypothetical protein
MPVISLPILTLTEWLMAAAAALCIGCSKAGFGGFGLIAVLLMAEVMPAKESTGVILPMLIAADLMAIGNFHRHVSWSDFWALLPTTFCGLLAGTFLMRQIPVAIFGHVLGWMILAMMLLVIWQRFDRRVLSGITQHPLLATGAGFLAGITTMIANAGGPAMTFYLLSRRLEKMAFVGTCAWFFFVINLTKIPLSSSLGLISLKSLVFNLILLPAVVIGMLLGKLFLGKIPQQQFEWLLLLTALGSAIRFILA